ncbi:hypothetical protein YC2023_048032 [Brassica napus]
MEPNLSNNHSNRQDVTILTCFFFDFLLPSHSQVTETSSDQTSSEDYKPAAVPRTEALGSKTNSFGLDTVTKDSFIHVVGPLLTYIGPLQGPRQAQVFIPLGEFPQPEMEALHIHLASLVLSTAPDTNTTSSPVTSSSQVRFIIKSTWRN